MMTCLRHSSKVDLDVFTKTSEKVYGLARISAGSEGMDE